MFINPMVAKPVKSRFHLNLSLPELPHLIVQGVGTESCLVSVMTNALRGRATLDPHVKEFNSHRAASMFIRTAEVDATVSVVGRIVNARKFADSIAQAPKEEADEIAYMLLWMENMRDLEGRPLNAHLVRDHATTLIGRSSLEAVFPDMASLIAQAPPPDKLLQRKKDASAQNGVSIDRRIAYVPIRNDRAYPVETMEGARVLFNWEKRASVYTMDSVYLVRSGEDVIEAAGGEMAFRIYGLNAGVKPTILMTGHSGKADRESPHDKLDQALAGLHGVSHAGILSLRAGYLSGYVRVEDNRLVLYEVMNGSMYHDKFMQGMLVYVDRLTEYSRRTKAILGGELGMEVGFASALAYNQRHMAKLRRGCGRI